MINAHAIPPGTIVMLTAGDIRTPNWLADIGKVYRIGYYSEQDGLSVVWLVDEHGDYLETCDPAAILDHFTILHWNDETDLYGHGKPQFAPFTPAELDRYESIRQTMLHLPQTA